MRKFICETCGSASLDLCICHEDKPARQHISARLDSDLIASIKERARTERRSTNNLIECLLFEAMEESK